jgi:hypothetical protein
MRLQHGLWLALALAGCGDDDGGDADAAPAPTWQVVHEELPGALLSVWGSADDVWSVGGDPGDGPTVRHYDGSSWQTLDTGSAGDLWWVSGSDGDVVYQGGAGGTVLRYQGGDFTPMDTPSAGPAVFGVWGCSESDVWAVGGNIGGGSGGFVWHLEDGEWVDVPLPDDTVLPVWKVWGRSCSDVRFVGEAGLAMSWDGSGLTIDETGLSESLFTVHGNDDCYVASGGFGTGSILEDCGSGWEDVSPAGASALVGVCMRGDTGTAVGWYGAVYHRLDGVWVADDQPAATDETLHACWIDPQGGVWAVGGQVQAFPLVRGVMIYRGDRDLGVGWAR